MARGQQPCGNMTTTELKFLSELINHINDTGAIFIIEEDRDLEFSNMNTFAGVTNGWGKEQVKKGIYVYGSALNENIFLKYCCEIAFPLPDTDEQLYYFNTDKIYKR